MYARAVRWIRVALAVAVIAVGVSWLVRGLAASAALVVLWPAAVVQLTSSALFNPRLRRGKVHLFEEALVVVDAAKIVRVVRWSEVLMVLHRSRGISFPPLRLHVSARCTVVAIDGSVVALGTEWQGLEALSLEVSRRAAKAQLPGVQAALRQGAEVRFGDVIVSAAGVRTPDGSAAWAQTAPVVMTRRGQIRIDTREGLRPLVAASLAATPNPVLLMAVVRGCQEP